MFLTQYFQHPSVTILVSIICLVFLKNKHSLFKALVIITPIISAVILFLMPQENSLEISSSISLSYVGSWHNKLIGYAFLFVLLSANLNTIYRKKYIEIILGNLYASCTIFCLLAGDFLSLFISLELMAISSAIIIFVGKKKESLRAAKKYFITHLMSGNMIIIGIIHLYSIDGSIEIKNIAQLIDNEYYSYPIILIMLTGLLINIACFPFAGWMVNYYPKASKKGFVYLIIFTTKLSIMLLIKLFAGLTLLKYIAVIMIIYSSMQVIFEKHLLSIICHLSIISMGFMLMGISMGNVEIIDAVICYLFMHILYKLTLSLACSNIKDPDFNNLLNHNNNLIYSALIIAVATMIAIPGSFIFIVKAAISSNLRDDLISYGAVIIFSFILSFAISWKEVFHSIKTKIRTKELMINKYSRYAIIVASSATLFFTLFGQYLIYSNDFSLFPQGSLKQLFILILSIICSYHFKYKRSNTDFQIKCNEARGAEAYNYNMQSLNLIELVGDLIFYFHRKKNIAKTTAEFEPISFHSFELQCKRFFNRFHDQQTAIFIVFTLLLIILYVN